MNRGTQHINVSKDKCQAQTLKRQVVFSPQNLRRHDLATNVPNVPFARSNKTELWRQNSIVSPCTFFPMVIRKCPFLGMWPGHILIPIQ